MNPEKDFTTSIMLDQSPTEVFEAINNPRGWWQGAFVGDTNQLNDEFTYQSGDVHFSKQKVIEWVPDQKVVWLVTESKINFVADKNEWLDTKLVFEITTVEDKTKVTFTHRGLKPALACYKDCSGAWESLVSKSLFSFITTGKGVHVF